MRERILDAAADLLAENGYAGTTVQAVAVRAGCAAGSVYNHFADKEDLLGGLLERWAAVESAKVGLGAAGDSDFERFLRAWLDQRTDAVASNDVLLRALLAEMLVRGSLRERYRSAVLEPRLEAGAVYLERLATRGRASVQDPELVARLLTAATLGLGVLRLLDEPRTIERWDELREALAELLVRGLVSGAE